MRRFFATLVAVFLASSTAHASPWAIIAPVDVPEMTPQVTTLRRGDPAPYDGVLMNNVAAAEVVVERENAEKKCQIEVDRAVALKDAEMQLTVDELRAANKAAAERLALEERINKESIERLSAELEREQHRAKGSRWNGLYLAGGLVAGVLVVVAGAFAVRGVREADI
jgi:hypothetical protein